jgi:hypothetical protein
MTNIEILEIIKLISALESWSFSVKDRFPDYLQDKIDSALAVLTKELLK